ncbi:phosphonopyruvate decarboxylase [Flavivirga spongiicola]|uniref:Phosphonopyruvate decarboxylase n=1 Tax=Flavivirga spongiicola TaxID=421621 RepID=A0ABU7XXW5_9FLAO|nr:phosphonopyruvate decarboxylase [Flavivirga sp. MEBiC05379]MDO5980417.1 phosphonopyruvate decarboxylase [Flavivirga sp. MEBiC05379]
MISVKTYFDVFKNNDVNFFTGVPDSLLKNFVSYVSDNLKESDHVITANEGASIALASGYHLATNKVPVIYMQNSGLGNAVNPLLSLANENVYSIPLLLLIGWRGEPNVKDEPQHFMQGQTTLSMLDVMEIPYIIIDDDETTSITKTKDIINQTKRLGKPHAIVVKKGVFSSYKLQSGTQSDLEMSRETAMKIVTDFLSEKDIVVSTTGKLSRELFEYRVEKKQTHSKDFLTVGSMGHASMIALGIAKEKKKRKVYCFDGDGAVLMHTGSLSSIGSSGLKNYRHIVFNNGAHESVGGQSTLGFSIDMPQIANSCGYTKIYSVSKTKELKDVLVDFNSHQGVAFLEIKVRIDSRSNLGRPTTTPIENKKSLMKNILTNDKK